MARPRKTDRTERVPMGGLRTKLSVDEALVPKGMAKRWFADRAGRLNQAQAAGFTFLDDPDIKVGEGVEDGKDSMSSHIRRRTGVHEDGTPMYSYLMVQPMRYYKEDRALYNKELDKTDEAIRRGAIGDETGRYVPPGGIQYKTTKG